MLQMLGVAFMLGVIVAMPIGPVFIAAARRALVFGFPSALLFNLGSTTSDALYVGAVYLGLAPLLAESELLRLLLWTLGGAWLCWLGVDAIRNRIQLPSADAAPLEQESGWRSYSSGLGITLFNPLTIVSWIALAGNFFATWQESYPPREQYGWLAMLAILLGVMGYAALTSWCISWLRRFVSPRVVRGASVLAGLGLLLFGFSAWLSALRLLL